MEDMHPNFKKTTNRYDLDKLTVQLISCHMLINETYKNSPNISACQNCITAHKSSNVLDKTNERRNQLSCR